MWDPGFPSAFVIRQAANAGQYLVGGNVQLSAGSPAVQYSQLRLVKNRGTGTEAIIASCTLHNTGDYTDFFVASLVTLLGNDYIELMFFTLAGATVSLGASQPQTPQFWITKVS
jgi:hypothetical protein